MAEKGLPESPQLTNQHTNTYPELQTPSVPQGTINMAVVGAEARRQHNLLHMAQLGNAVTDTELGNATCREIMALGLAAPQDIAPAWFNQAMQAMEGRMMQAMEGRMQAMEGRLEMEIRATKALITNQRLFEWNKMVYGSAPRDPSMYERIAKSTPGFAEYPPPSMRILPNAPPAVQAILDGEPPEPGPNVFPPEAFPFLTTSRSTLTSLEVGYLGRWYNDTFGIVDGDTQEIHVEKLKQFLRGF